MPTRDPISASGWLPVEALDDLDDKRRAASREEAERLIALPPRDRALALMQLAAAGAEAPSGLGVHDLHAVLASFEGTTLPDAEALAGMFPALPTA